MNSADLAIYQSWFLGMIHIRESELNSAIACDMGPAWTADHSRNSVEQLASWLSAQVETRPRTPDEIALIDKRFGLDEGSISNELTSRTFSLCIDAGMYIGETLKAEHPHLEWIQSPSSKKFSDYGHMVLRGFGPVMMNPVAVVITFCYGISRGSRSAARLVEGYDYWSRLAASAQLG